MKILICPDSFKGSLSASEVSAACAEAIREFDSSIEYVQLPLADGGEGTVAAIGSASGWNLVECEVSGPLGEKVQARYAVSDDGENAVMEMASAAGITLVDLNEPQPLETSTYGVGEMIQDAAARGCKKILIGIGGSCTTDCGMGMLQALGCKFLDSDGNKLRGCGGNLGIISEIDMGPLRTLNTLETLETLKTLNIPDIVVACDVRNHLYGKDGAAYVYAPQKGANPRQVEILDAGLRHFAWIVKDAGLCDMQSIEGGGAAGGLGAALAVFLGAEMKSGVECVLDAVGFDKALDGCDLVITGEGKVDKQSLMGKLISGVRDRCIIKGVPMAVIAGKVDDGEVLEAAGLTHVYQITPAGMPLSEAMDKDKAIINIKDTIRKRILR